MPFRVLAALLACLVSIPAFAATPYKGDTFIAIGGYFPSIDTSARLNGSGGGVGTEINIEDDLGVEDSDTSLLFDFHYQFNDRHGFGLSYFDLNRKGKKVITGTVDWGDQTYDVGAAVQSKFNNKTYRVYYDYTFLTNSKYALSLSAGLHITEIEVELAALTGIDGEVQAGTAQNTSVTAPLPVLGLRGTYRINPDWMLNGKAEYFALTVDNTKGSIVNLGVGVAYDGIDYFTIGLNYDYFGVNVETDDGNLHADVDFNYHGPMITIGTYF